MDKGKGSRARWAWDAWKGLDAVGFGRRSRIGPLMADLDRAILDLGADRVYVRWVGKGANGMAADYANNGWRRVDDPAIRAALGWGPDDGDLGDPA